jgi:PAS domain S-box-containing protein
MSQIIESSNPILLLVAVILTFMASYTSIDLLILLRTSETNKRFLFLGGSFSMGMAIWTFNFFGILAFDQNGAGAYNIPVTILSMVLGVALAGMGFMFVSTEKIRFLHVCCCSLLLTLSVLSNYIIGMYALNNGIFYHLAVLSGSFLLIMAMFLCSFMILFYANHWNRKNKLWFKPLSTLIVTIAIAEGHFLLARSMPPKEPIKNVEQLVNGTPFVINLVFFVSVLIVAGLVGSAMIMNKRLAKSDKYLRDFRYALDQSAIVAITDSEGKITYVNDKFVQISKYSEEELMGRSHSIISSGYHTQAFYKEMWQTISSGETWKGEICNKAKDGTLYWVDTTIVPFMRRKKPYQYISIRTDISARKRAEADLKETMKDIRDIHYALDQSAIVAFTDEKGNITKVNDKLCDISQYSREELIGRNHNILNSGYHSREFFQEMWRTISSGNVWKGELRNRSKDGNYYWVGTTIVPFLDENGEPYQYISIRTDITKRKETEDMLHRQDKLAAIGQLAAGVAHEIRNPLTTIKGYAEYLQLDEQSGERNEYLDIILDEIERVNDIVEDFMVLAKPQSINLEEENMVSIIQSVFSFLEIEAKKKNISFYLEYNQENIMVRCDKNRIKQVFLNFSRNSMDAMPDGGTIKAAIQIKGQNVSIIFKDTGGGIPPEALEKLGEPFFTTKSTGNGLGLMVSYNIIENHGGTVEVESEINKGTAFHIELPAANGKQEQ